MTKINTAVHIFRRDLRIEDNTALNAALDRAAQVLPIFIFDPSQCPAPESVTPPHQYFSAPAFSFLLQSLRELANDLSRRQGRLACFRGSPLETHRASHTEIGLGGVFFNRDYTPFARSRDSAIQRFCAENNIECHILADSLLVEPEGSVKSDGTPYTIFTPFFKRNSQSQIRSPSAIHSGNYYSHRLKCEVPNLHETYLANSNNSAKYLVGGRSHALSILEDIGRFSNYKAERNFPAVNATTHLSAHNKFGTCSVREVYHRIVETLGADHELIRELYWRDFFTHIAFHFPHVFREAFNQRYINLQWKDSPAKFDLWCRGQTGFPIVDAGMRELNESGFMHNRVRMIVASFLTKDLHIDWRAGERYFATKLVDYDPAVNNGNWQWAASTGCDAQPYFRIFNPWLQQRKFDPEAAYIKKWIPELQSFSAKLIHNLSELEIPRGDYPRPLVDHDMARIEAQEMFEE